jgi:hypothetical protein
MAVPRASDPVLFFARPKSFLAVPRASGPVFMFCGPRLVFWQYRGCRVPISFFALPDSFFAFLRLSGPVFLFCVPGLVFDGTKGESSRINVLRAETHFRRYRERRVKFSCFALPDSLSAVPTATNPIFMFFTPKLIFDRNKGVGSHFQILRARTRFRRCQVRWVLFSCFARQDSFSAIPRTLGPVFMFCAPGLVFGGTEGVGSRFHIFRAHTHFLRYQGRSLPFSCFAVSDSFSAVQWASGAFFMFCAPEFVFGGTEGVGTNFQFLRTRTHFLRYEGRFHVFRALTRFRL